MIIVVGYTQLIERGRTGGVFKTKKDFLTQNAIPEYIFLFDDILYITEGYWRFKSHVSGTRV